MAPRAKSGDLPSRFDRLVRTAPWWLLGAEFFGLLPGYYWWLFTGDAVAAKLVLRVGFFCSMALLMVFLVAFFLPAFLWYF